MQTKFPSGSRSSTTGGFWRWFGPIWRRSHYDSTTTAWRRPDDDVPTARRRETDGTTRPPRCDDGATTVRSPGSASNPSLWHVISLGSAPNPGYDMSSPGLWRSSRTVVASSSCRRQAVVMPSVYRSRAVGTSSSCCRAIAVRQSAHCRRAVAPIVISTRRDCSYPTSACLLNFASMYIYICKYWNIYAWYIYIYMYAYIYICIHILRMYVHVPHVLQLSDKTFKAGI